MEAQKTCRKVDSKTLWGPRNDKVLDYPVTSFSNFWKFHGMHWFPGLHRRDSQNLDHNQHKESGKHNGLIAGAPKEIHQEKQNIPGQK